MEKDDKTCKVCGVEKPIYEFSKKGKFKYRTECKVCYNKSRREFNKLSEEEKLILKEESINKEIIRKMVLEENRKIKELEGKEKKRRKQDIILEDYNKRMEMKSQRRLLRLKNYCCNMCGETIIENFYPKRKSRCKKCILSTSTTNQFYSNMTDDKKKIYIQNNREWVGGNIIKVRVLAAKHRSIKKNIPFEINEEIINEKYILQDGKCFISKQPLVLKENDWYGLSLDRLDSNLGYTIENTILVTKFVNTSKNNLSYDDYIKLLKEVCINV